MANLKSLAKDTAIYGLSSIVARFVNYLLVPIQTMKFASTGGEYGIITNVYAYVAILIMVLTFGMETTFFRFMNKEGMDREKVYSIIRGTSLKCLGENQENQLIFNNINLKVMIYLKVVKKYCKNYEQIENYQEAINSPRAYHCHHRKELDEKMSQKELIRKKLYYNRPPEELIFLSYEEHLRLHHKGKVWSEESKKKLSQTRRSNGKSKGSNNPMYGVHRYGSTAGFS